MSLSPCDAAILRPEVYVVGHRGLVGSAIWPRLQAEGFTNLVGRSRAEMPLEDRESVFEFFAANQPRYVVPAAAKVGGILANSDHRPRRPARKRNGAAIPAV